MLTEILSREHLVVLQKLAVLEQALAPFDEAKVREVLHFFDHQIVLHRRKEEEILFPRLASHFPENAGPVFVMLEEHREEKRHIEGMRSSLGAGDSAAVAMHARHILDLLRQHIAKEDQVLFPMAEEMLADAERPAVERGFREIGTFSPVGVAVAAVGAKPHPMCPNGP
ncbi:MAG: hemerythrin domain-containing protein [Planctomycetes bacterium]|nr:hemerythrin domain-containing protein [Planctomycetota bacterium]